MASERRDLAEGHAGPQEEATTMSNGFDALVTDVKARMAKLIGMLRPGSGAKPGSDGTRGASATPDATRHPTSSFRESVGKPTQSERAANAAGPKRQQDPGD